MRRIFGRRSRGLVFRPLILACFGVCVLLCGFASAAKCQQSPDGASQNGATVGQQAPAEAVGSVTGTVLYETGVPLAGARVRLTREGQPLSQDVMSGEQGEFAFRDIVPGPFQITVSGQDFETKSFTGVLQSGQTFFVPQIVMSLAAVVTEVRVKPQEEIAQEQVQAAEKQRVLGFIPNFYVSYDTHPVPLNTRQKFSLAWKSSIDPVTILGAAAVAGVDQGLDRYPGYGQGAQGYGKRFGADYADIFLGTMIGSAAFPSLLKQDPRYFYKGTGSTRSRLLYALANTVICKGDNGRWQPNYSDFLGGIATGGIANLYATRADRGVGLVFDTLLLRLTGSAAAGVFQEFLSRRLTPSVDASAMSTSQP